MLELMNGEVKNDKNISKEEIEDSIFNTIKITNRKVRNMKKENDHYFMCRIINYNRNV